MKTAMTAGEHVREAEKFLSSRPCGLITGNLAIGHALAACAIELGMLVEMAKTVDEPADPTKVKPQPE